MVDKAFVFSVYSHELENYPYYPYVAKTVTDGLKKFIRQLRDKQTICAGAELHIIGTCERVADVDGAPAYENIQPLAFPQRVTFKKDWLGRLCSRVVYLDAMYSDKIACYLLNFLKGKKNDR